MASAREHEDVQTQYQAERELMRRQVEAHERIAASLEMLTQVLERSETYGLVVRVAQV